MFIIMINSILEALSFDFFVRALIFGVMISIIFSMLWIFVVAKKEANISHTISNFGLVGISIALLFWINIDFSILISCIVWIGIIYLAKQTKIISNDSIMEIGAQLFMAAAVITISQIKWYQANISNYLFGDILAISNNDIYIWLIIVCIIVLFITIFKKRLIQTIFNDNIAKSIWTNINIINILYISILALAISTWMKILWALLISAFLIIPANIAKLLAKNFKQMNIYAIIIWVISTTIWLFISYIFDIPSGATIIAFMGCLLLWTILIKKLFLR